MSKQLDIKAAKRAIQATETMDGLRLEGNNHKIGQLLSMRDHLINALALIESQPVTLDQIFLELRRRD